MNTRKFLCSIAILSFVVSCKKDDPAPNPAEENQTCIVLTGNQTTPINLTNHNSDPNIPDYCVEGNYSVLSDVVVEPGVLIQMKNGSRIYVNGAGSFKSVGTASAKITIRGENLLDKGQWQYIRFGTNDTDNRLEYTNVTGGGSDNTYNAMVFVQYDGYVNIDHSYIGFSSSNGLKAENADSNFGTIANTDFSFNDLYPISIDAKQLGKISSSITGTSNGIEKIFVDASQINSPLTWNNCIIPYHLNGTLGIVSPVVVQPGTKIFMAGGSCIQIMSGGSLNCVGTATEKIVFTGDNATNGDWEYIRFSLSTSTQNRFEHCELSYGGGNATYQGIITLWQASYVRIGNSTIKNSARYGLFNNNNTSTFVDDGNNTWSGNTLGNLGS